jgi:hypothetical protein
LSAKAVLRAPHGYLSTLHIALGLFFGKRKQENISHRRFSTTMVVAARRSPNKDRERGAMCIRVHRLIKSEIKGNEAAVLVSDVLTSLVKVKTSLLWQQPEDGSAALRESVNSMWVVV